jgi:hypothetical protein
MPAPLITYAIRLVTTGPNSHATRQSTTDMDMERVQEGLSNGDTRAQYGLRSYSPLLHAAPEHLLQFGIIFVIHGAG